MVARLVEEKEVLLGMIHVNVMLLGMLLGMTWCDLVRKKAGNHASRIVEILIYHSSIFKLFLTFRFFLLLYLLYLLVRT